MKAWWLTDSARMGREKRAVEALVDEGWFQLTRWYLHEYRLAADGVITARGAEYPVRLVYPDQFPSVPAWVEPQDLAAKWSDHQYGKGGVLCLELRPDNWTPDATGADVLRSAFNLLSIENPEGEGDRGTVESAHSVGSVQRYDWSENPALISVGCFLRLLKGEASDVRALRWAGEDKVWPILISDAPERAQPQRPPGIDLSSFRVELPVLIAKGAIPETTPSNRDALASAAGIEIEAGANAGVVVVIVADDELVAFHSPDAETVARRKWILLSETGGKRSDRAPAAVGKKVAIVGLGSVGSKLAEIFLRSGIYRFVLVDGDVMFPENLERHTLDWRDVGFRKVSGIKRRLLQIVPGAEIEAIAGNLNWQRSARLQSSYIDDIADCDLIIDSTGDVPTALMLGEIAAVNEKPFLSVQVFEGGLGCVVARSVPGKDPPFSHARVRFNAYCEEQSVEPPPSGQRRYEAITNDGDPIVADDAAVSMAAAHAARVGLNILDGCLAATDAAWLLIGFREGWLFRHHGHSISLEMGPPTELPSPPFDKEAFSFAKALVKEAIDAAKSSQ